jgi:hypothetical protein
MFDGAVVQIFWFIKYLESMRSIFKNDFYAFLLVGGRWRYVVPFFFD